MRKRWFSTLVFLIGLAIFASPFVSQAYNAMHQTGIARSVDRRAENLDTRMVNTLTEKAEKRNNSNKTGVTEKSLKSLNKPAEAVSDMITIPDSQALGTISIPKIDVYLPIYDGVSEKELQKGAGLLPGSSIPLGGHGEHAVITGHSGLPNKIMFTNIGKLKKGDLFFIQVLGKEFTYEVDKKKVVTPENVEDLALHHPDNFVTLVTCTPYGVNSHRLLVRGHLTDKRPAPTVIWEQWWLMLLLASGLIAIVALLLWLIRRTIKRRKAK